MMKITSCFEDGEKNSGGGGQTTTRCTQTALDREGSTLPCDSDGGQKQTRGCVGGLGQIKKAVLINIVLNSGGRGGKSQLGNQRLGPKAGNRV